MRIPVPRIGHTVLVRWEGKFVPGIVHDVDDDWNTTLSILTGNQSMPIIVVPKVPLDMHGIDQPSWHWPDTPIYPL